MFLADFNATTNDSNEAAAKLVEDLQFGDMKDAFDAMFDDESSEEEADPRQQTSEPASATVAKQQPQRRGVRTRSSAKKEAGN